MTITLTHEEAQQVLNALENSGGLTVRDAVQRVSAIKTLRAKLSEPEPEPVAFLSQTRKNYVVVGQPQWNVGIEDWIPLYTAPPQRKECLRCGEVNPAEIHTCTPKREWVGLTGEELQEIYQGAGTVHFKFAMVEAKLKEKNNG